MAVGAIRYFMLKFSRGKLIVFDIEEALNFEGETGPYLQYAVVRANNIFLKLRERAQTELGGKYEIRAFHDEILNGAALPLDVLDQRVTAWIEAQKAGSAGAGH